MCAGFSSPCSNPGLAFVLKCNLAVAGDPESSEWIHFVGSFVCKMKIIPQKSGGGGG